MIAADSTVGAAAWPRFPVDGWDQTAATLHMWTQVVGKVRLALAPAENHYWHVPLYVATRGLTTSPIPYGSEHFEIGLDFVGHKFELITSWGPGRSLPLSPRSVADFHTEVMSALRDLGVDVRIWPTPVEVAEPIPFAQDHAHASYDPAAVEAFWRVLVRADHIFKAFRGRFLGKSSPVHFFWGGFDLAVTRFSGRRAPMFSGPSLNVNPHVMHTSYSHEVCSAGFWPGNADVAPMFYCYAVPEPAGFREAVVARGGASYSEALGEFVLPYEVVRSAERSDDTLLNFLQESYAAAADLGGWDRVLLEQSPPCMCDVDGEK
jgi:hypothetical protein